MTIAYAYCPASASRYGYSWIFLVSSIEVHPLERLQVDWVCSGLGSGHMTPHRIISHIARLSTSSFLMQYNTNHHTTDLDPPIHTVLYMNNDLNRSIPWDLTNQWIFVKLFCSIISQKSPSTASDHNNLNCKYICISAFLIWSFKFIYKIFFKFRLQRVGKKYLLRHSSV
jgi:hypothetical protein